MEYIKNAAKISFRYKRELYENSEKGKHIYLEIILVLEITSICIFFYKYLFT